MNYRKFMKSFNGKYRLLTGLALLLAGLIWQFLSGKTLDMYAYYIMAAAVFCVANVIVEKLSGGEADIILYVVLNLAVLIAGFVLTGFTSTTTGAAVMHTVWVLCVLVDWAVNAFLIQCDDIFKRVVMGFAAAVLNVAFAGIVFIIPILIAAF